MISIKAGNINFPNQIFLNTTNTTVIVNQKKKKIY